MTLLLQLSLTVQLATFSRVIDNAKSHKIKLLEIVGLVRFYTADALPSKTTASKNWTYIDTLT